MPADGRRDDPPSAGTPGPGTPDPGDVTGTPAGGGEGGSNDGLGRILTVPNVITALRLAGIPVFVWLLLVRHEQAAAAALLAVLGATDFVDGWIARHFDQVTTLGKILDPTVDRLLLITGAVCIAIDGSVPWWFLGAALGREVLVAVSAVVLAAAGARRIDVSWLGKAGTFGLMTAFPLLLAGADDLAVSPLLRTLGWVVGIPALVLAWVSAFGYVGVARRALAEGRAARRAGVSPTEGVGNLR